MKGIFKLSPLIMNNNLIWKLILNTFDSVVGFPLSSVGKEYVCNAWGPGFESWFLKIPWRRKWQSYLVFLPGKSHGQRSLVGCTWGRKESDMIE